MTDVFAYLRVSGRTQPPAAFTGDSTWKDLTTDFVVEQPEAEIELGCELRARAGEVWFDMPALRVLRNDKNYEN